MKSHFLTVLLDQDKAAMPANIKKARKFGGQCETTSPKMSKSTQVTNTLITAFHLYKTNISQRQTLSTGRKGVHL